MSDDQNTTSTEDENIEADKENQNSEENSLPVSPKEPMVDTPIQPMDSEPTEMPLEASEAPQESFSDESNNIAPSNSTFNEGSDEEKIEEKSVESEPLVQPNSEPSPTYTESPDPLRQSESNVGSESAQIHEPRATIPESEVMAENETAQIPVNEPSEFDESESVTKSEPVRTQSPNVEPEIQKPKPAEEVVIPKISKPVKHEETKMHSSVIPAIVVPVANKARELWSKALNAIQRRKRKKLDKIMSLFLKQSEITNDEVEKFLHVSNATVTRYLTQLEKEGKIKQNGKTGRSVSYSKI